MKTLALLPFLLWSMFRDTSFDFNGSASINGCSGALFIMKGMVPTQKALLITNGHCIRLKDLRGSGTLYPAPGERIHDLEVPEVREKTHLTLHSGRGSWNLAPEKLLFATMTGTDIAIYELGETYQELDFRYGLKPFALDREPLKRGNPVVIHAGNYNRTELCQMDGWANLREGPYHTNQAVRFSPECSIYNGFSGSPVMKPGSRIISALANTHYDEEAEGLLCDIGKTCEVDDQGQVLAPKNGQSYGVSVHRLYDCFDGKRLNFRTPRCPWAL